MTNALHSPGSAALASLAAGPIFAVSTAAAALYMHMPRPIEVEPAYVAPVLMMIVPIVAIGFVLSILLNLLGSRMLYFTGVLLPKTRAPAVWIGAGAAFGTFIAWQTTGFAEPAVAFGLVTTSACCGAICRYSAFWD